MLLILLMTYLNRRKLSKKMLIRFKKYYNKHIKRNLFNLCIKDFPDGDKSVLFFTTNKNSN
jgi:hypothetical protein